ncbi:hypothetical protein BBJ28_00025197, partial [Nothophytophthora sp. Chile5]
METATASIGLADQRHGGTAGSVREDEPMADALLPPPALGISEQVPAANGGPEREEAEVLSRQIVDLSNDDQIRVLGPPSVVDAAASERIETKSGRLRCVADGRALAEACGVEAATPDNETATEAKVVAAIAAWAAAAGADASGERGTGQDGAPTVVEAALAQESEAYDVGNARVLRMRVLTNASSTQLEREKEQLVKMLRKAAKRKKRARERKQRLALVAEQATAKRREAEAALGD